MVFQPSRIVTTFLRAPRQALAALVLLLGLVAVQAADTVTVTTERAYAFEEAPTTSPERYGLFVFHRTGTDISQSLTVAFARRTPNGLSNAPFNPAAPGNAATSDFDLMIETDSGSAIQPSLSYPNLGGLGYGSIVFPPNVSEVRLRVVANIQAPMTPPRMGRYVVVGLPGTDNSGTPVSYGIGPANTAQVAIVDGNTRATISATLPLTDEIGGASNGDNGGVSTVAPGVVRVEWNQSPAVYARRVVELYLDQSDTSATDPFSLIPGVPGTDYRLLYKISRFAYGQGSGEGFSAGVIEVVQPIQYFSGTTFLPAGVSLPTTATNAHLVIPSVGATVYDVTPAGEKLQISPGLQGDIPWKDFEDGIPATLSYTDTSTTPATNNVQAVTITANPVVYPKETVVVDLSLDGLVDVGDVIVFDKTSSEQYLIMSSNLVLNVQAMLVNRVTIRPITGNGYLAEDVGLSGDLLRTEEQTIATSFNCTPDANGKILIAVPNLSDGLTPLPIPGAPTSHHVEFVVIPNDNLVADGGKQVTFRALLSNANNGYEIAQPAVAQVIIRDNDAVADVSTVDYASEPTTDGGDASAVAGHFQVGLTQPAAGDNLWVSFRLTHQGISSATASWLEQVVGAATYKPDFTLASDSGVITDVQFDRQANLGAVRIPRGLTTARIVVVAPDDGLVESSANVYGQVVKRESFKLGLIDSPNYVLVQGTGPNPNLNQADMAIDDPVGQATITPQSATVFQPQNALNPGIESLSVMSIKVARRTGQDDAVDVPVQVGGVAQWGTDYDLYLSSTLPGTITAARAGTLVSTPPNPTVVSLPARLLGDTSTSSTRYLSLVARQVAADGDSATFTLLGTTVQRPNPSNGVSTVTLRSNVVNFLAPGSASIALGASGIVTVNLAVAPTDLAGLDVGFATDGSTALSTSYALDLSSAPGSVSSPVTGGYLGSLHFAPGQRSASFTVRTSASATADAGNSVSIQLSASTLYKLATPSQYVITLLPPPPQNAQVNGSGASLFEGRRGSLTIARTTLDTTRPLVLNVGIGASTATGSDYTLRDSTGAPLGGVVTIPSGSLETTILVDALIDAIQDGSQVLNLTFTGADALTTVSTPTASLTILNNQVSVSASAATVSGGGVASFVFSLSASIPQATSISFSTGGTAVAGTHFTAPTSPVTILANAISATVPITTLAVSGFTGTRTLSVNLTSAISGATSLATSVTAGTTTLDYSSVTPPPPPADPVSTGGGGGGGGCTAGGGLALMGAALLLVRRRRH